MLGAPALGVVGDEDPDLEPAPVGLFFGKRTPRTLVFAPYEDVKHP